MFYTRIERLCNENGIKLTPLTSELGYSTGNIANWKKGKAPSGDIIIKFATHFNVTTDYLLGLTENPEREKEALSIKEYKLLKAYREADEKTKEAAEKILDIYVKAAEPEAENKKEVE